MFVKNKIKVTYAGNNFCTYFGLQGDLINRVDYNELNFVTLQIKGIGWKV
jgi:hypothetical protein